MKIIVNKMPSTPKECLFAEYIDMTSKNKCMFQNGLYSRCKLECGRECNYLKVDEKND